MSEGAAFTIDHFRRYANLMVFDDGKQRGLEDWQLCLVEDLFRGYERNVWIIPEGNGKSTLVSILALYGADYTEDPWIPVGASSGKQARIIHSRAAGFIRRTPGFRNRFRVYKGYLKITPRTSSRDPMDPEAVDGIDIFAHDPNTGDGVIPAPYALVDEMHRHPDMHLWDLWCGKLDKRGAQIIGISTAGEPETQFENLRESIRLRATKRKRDGAFDAHLRAEAPGEVYHEWMVPTDELCSNMDAVKAANPLSAITPERLAGKFAKVTDLGEWKRLKCDRPHRSSQSAITETDWDRAEIAEGIPAGARIDVGLDIAFQWDTTALVPLWRRPPSDEEWEDVYEAWQRRVEEWEEEVAADDRGEEPPPPRPREPNRDETFIQVLGPAKILVPPRDGSFMHPSEIYNALGEIAKVWRIEALVMDTSRAQDIASWIEDNAEVETVVDRKQSQQFQVQDYAAFTEGLRQETLKHTGDKGLKAHVLNAVARRVSDGVYVFDRPSEARTNVNAQDRRVIDALTAAAMVVWMTTRREPKKTSVYEQRMKRAAGAAA